MDVDDGPEELKVIRHRLDRLVTIRLPSPWTPREQAEFDLLAKREHDLLNLGRGAVVVVS